jgi:hypothetical protein
MHLRHKAPPPGPGPNLVQDIGTVSQARAAIRRRFRRRGVRAPRQLLLGHSFERVPTGKSMSKNPAWPLRRALEVVEVKNLFPRLDRGEGVPEVAVHQQLLSEVICSLREGEGPTERLFADKQWERVESSAPRQVIHSEQEWIPLRNGGGYGLTCRPRCRPRGDRPVCSGHKGPAAASDHTARSEHAVHKRDYGNGTGRPGPRRESEPWTC